METSALTSRDSPLAAPARFVRRWAVVVGAVLVLAACGSSDDGTDDAASSTTTEATTTTTTAPSTSSTAPPGGPLPAAADGSDLAACSDGNCEVLVETFPVEVRLDGVPWLMSITLELAGPDGMTSVHTDAGGVSRMTARVGQTSTYSNGTDNLVVAPVAIDGGAAVVRLSIT